MNDLGLRTINTIRALSIDAVQNANSGHPGLPLGAAPMAYVLWQRHLRHAPSDPSWPDRDRFVLSAGHGSMLLYSLMHLSGYDLTIDDLKAFRRLHSKTPGHPESFMTSGVECTTGPLGQGSANVIGMAIAERYLAELFNRPGHELVNHRSYAIVSDGDLMEGVSAEAASLAGHLKLGKLTYLYDANDISLDGPTSLTFSEDVAKRYASYGWHVQRVEDGDHDLNAIDSAITQAHNDERPSIIIVKTTIGFGSPNKAGSSAAHGSPLGDDEVARTKEELGLDPTRSFFVPDDVRQHFSARARGESEIKAWREKFESFKAADPELEKSWSTMVSGKLPDSWDSALPDFPTGEKVATRKSSGQVLNAIAASVPWFFGGDADLSVSTNTAIKHSASFDAIHKGGRNIHFGVREHAMAAIANGIAYHGGPRTFVATFFVFSDYMRPSLRLAAMSHLPIISVWTHDSIGLGEDGPTHQPVEHLSSLRALPNLDVMRPADANEVREAWRHAMERRDGPTGLVLSRQALPTLDRTMLANADGVRRGAYVLRDGSALILIATGSEVSLTLDAADLLEREGIRARVVSMPCWELFERQDPEYQESVLPKTMNVRLCVEAGSSLGWHKWVGTDGDCVTLDTFGASGPGEEVMTHYGFDPVAIAQRAKQLLATI